MTAILSLMLGALGLGTALNDLGDQKDGLKAAKRIFDAVAEGESSCIDGLSNEGTRPPQRPTGRIELKNVNFFYPTRPDAKVCKNYNLTVEAGQVVALVGPSGSGKSTIINLLLRFYDPIDGQVFLDGEDISKLNVRWLRSQIGYVGQEPVLFQGSVADNIAKGRAEFGDTALLSLEEAMLESDRASKSASASTARTRTSKGSKDYSSVPVKTIEMAEAGVNVDAAAVDQDIINACIASNAHDFITTFPQGYGTDVGEGSIMVSGGQKQRIAIARALVKRPAVLLLDEATSALDAASERLVQQSIDALQQTKQQTTIVIAHRLSTIRNADKICVIDKGEVCEEGTHDELLAKEGLYAALWAKQKGITNTNSNSSKNLLSAIEEA